MHSQIPGALPLIGHWECSCHLSLEVKDCLDILSYYVYIVHMDFEYKPGTVVDENTWIIG